MKRLGFDFAKCGTASNYRSHIRYGIKPCRSCLQAEARRVQDCVRRGAAQGRVRVRPRKADRELRNEISRAMERAFCDLKLKQCTIRWEKQAEFARAQQDQQRRDEIAMAASAANRAIKKAQGYRRVHDWTRGVLPPAV